MDPADVSKFIEAKSDQLNAVDLLGRSIDVQITEARVTGGPTQPVTLIISGGEKPWKPCKTTMRIMARLWGSDANKWVGKSVRLFCDPDVTWAGVKVGGIRISGMSGIPGPQMVGYRVSQKVVAECRIDVIRPTSAPTAPAVNPRAELLACVKGMGATQIDIVEFYGEKTNRDVGPVDGWPDKDVTAVLARLRGDGAGVFREWLTARDAAPQWADADARNPPGDELPE
jgi:hypothetical protein